MMIVFFEIILKFIITIPVSNTIYQHVKYFIKRFYIDKLYQYIFKQVNGEDERTLNLSDEYIIWNLLKEKIY
jgi:hypothetical protein